MDGILLARPASHLWERVPLSLQAVIAVLVIILASSIYGVISKERLLAGLPLVTIDGLSPLESWRRSSSEVLKKGFNSIKGPFQIVDSTGPRVVFPHRFAEEVRANSAFTFAGAMRAEFFPDYPGFEGLQIFQGGAVENLIQDTVKQKLTPALQLTTGPLSEEADFALHKILGDEEEWRPSLLKQSMLEVVSRTTSRIFLGQPLCRDERWLHIATNYIMQVFLGSQELKRTPAVLRPVLHWFKPSCTEARKLYRDAKALIHSEMERRADQTRKTLLAGKKPAKSIDAISWMVDLSKGQQVDLVAAQLGMIQSASLTTTEAICQAVVRLAESPELVEPLREEVVRVLGETGWSTNAFFQMELMDSFFKECQRHDKPLVGMDRRAEREVVFVDGTKIRRGTRLMIEAKHLDPELYPDPYKFDARRFIRKRNEQDQRTHWQFTSTTMDHFGFGLGLHACPGRFLASNNMKIILSHLLLKYDWKMMETEKPLPPFISVEMIKITNPMYQLLFRRRTAEIDLSSLPVH